jgi:hypothetical protein
MFSKKPKKNSEPEPADSRRELEQMLRDAIDRNATVGIVRLGYSGQDPLAQGRLLKWDGEGISIEQLQIIGRDVRFTLGTRVEAFVKFRDTTIVFEAKVADVYKVAKLNDDRAVQSLRLSSPQLLRSGDRRSAFRSSITASGDEIPVRMWFVDRCDDEAVESDQEREYAQMYYTDLVAARRNVSLIPKDEDGQEPRDIEWVDVIRDVQVEKPHAIGRLVDLTANGLGLLMYGIKKMQLDRFERIVLRFDLEESSLDLVVEVRHSIDLRGSTCKVGTLIVHPGIGNMHAPQRRVLEQVAMRVQREQIRHRRSA